MHEKDSDENTKFLDIDTMRKRIPDDVAKDIIANDIEHYIDKFCK